MTLNVTLHPLVKCLFGHRCSGADAGTVFSWELRDPILLTEPGLLGPLNTLSAAGPVGEGYSTKNEDATRLGKYTRLAELFSFSQRYSLCMQQ